MADILGIHWAGIDRFVVFPILLLLMLLIMRNYKRIATVLGLLVHKKNQSVIFEHFSLGRYRLKVFLLCSGLLLLFLALLQPQWGKKESIIQQEGRDLLIIFDISRSMLAQDVKPSRLRSGVARIFRKISRSMGRSRILRAVESTTRRSAPIVFAMAVAGISIPLQLILPSSVTPNPFSSRNRATRLWAGESANSWMISDHILTTYEERI